jgi:hypothetical protein
MVIGKKFWDIYGAANYSPAQNAGIQFGGVASGTSITNVDAAVVSAIAALLATPATVGVSGNYIASGTLITAAVGTTLTLSQAAGANLTITNLVYWDSRRPSAAGGDSPIQALLCLDGSHGPLVFTDAAGKTTTVPASTLAKGAVYYFQIGTITTVTPGDFIGYSPN